MTRSRQRRVAVAGMAIAMTCAAALGETFKLIDGVDAGKYPGTGRMVAPSPGPGFPGTFYDGDRLAGTDDTGPDVVWQGLGTPTPSPNQYGATSFIFKRASVPLGPSGQYPLMGIDFLAGPLFDLDGDAGDATRSLVPISGKTAAAIPGSGSHVSLTIDANAGTVTLDGVDMTGTSEGGPGIAPEAGVTINVLAGTQADAAPGSAINPTIDTRTGTLTPFAGASTTLTHVWRIEDLGYEIWQDSHDLSSSTAGELGTFQFAGAFHGWLIERDPGTGQFPTLAGEGLGSTAWPHTDASLVGQVLVTANGLAGGSATIGDGIAGLDVYTAPGNGGVALADFGGDLGAYLDHVIAYWIAPSAARVVYLESTGVGVNNSADPIYPDSIGYDFVLLMQSTPLLAQVDADADGDVDLADFAAFLACFNGPNRAPATAGCAGPDVDDDNDVDLADFAAFLRCFNGPSRPPACGE